MKAIEFKNVEKKYNEGLNEIYALKNINFKIHEGEFVVIIGPSGAGKSTILNILGGLDDTTNGEIIVNNQDINQYDNNDLTEYRAKNIGFVFQFYNLIPMLTALENISVINNLVENPLNAQNLIEMVGLKNHENKFPPQLSGGEQQRIAIARALCKNPDFILCDEPTGALDSETGKTILKILSKMSKESQKTVIIVTHNQNIAKIADKIIHLKNGKIEEINTNQTPQTIDEINW